MFKSKDISHNLKAYDKDLILLFSTRVRNKRQAQLLTLSKTNYLLRIDKVFYKKVEYTMPEVYNNMEKI